MYGEVVVSKMLYMCSRCHSLSALVGYLSCKTKNNSLDCVTFSSSKFDKNDIFSENIIGVEDM